MDRARIVGDPAAGPAAAPAPSHASTPRTLRGLIGRVVAAWAASRVVSTLLFTIVAAVAEPGSRLGVHAGPVEVITAWDGQWYRLIAEQGYPTALPMQDGLVLQNAWAFYPLYPRLVQLLSAGDPQWWPWVAAALSTLAGGAAAVVLAVLVRPSAGERGALRTALLFMFSPVAFVLQVAYAESVALLLLFTALLLVERRRYLTAIPVVVLLAVTRPGLQALALCIAGILVLRRWQDGRATGRRRRRELVGAGALLATAAVGGWVWPWIAAASTGVPDAYLRSELAWRQSWSPTGFHPVLSWLSAAGFWLGPQVGPAALAVLLAGWVWLLLAPDPAVSGTARLWSASWTAYLLLVVFPQSSLLRLLMPMAPMGAATARLPPRWMAAVLLGSVALQAGWMYCLYGHAQRYWSVP